MDITSKFPIKSVSTFLKSNAKLFDLAVGMFGITENLTEVDTPKIGENFHRI